MRYTPVIEREMDQAAPRIVGRYVVHGEIAAGGMATVHLGRLMGEGGFARTVAIKRLHPHFARDPEFVEMFLDEARIAARIRHPHVVPTLDVVAEGKEILLVMEYVEGESLARLIRASRQRDLAPPPKVVATIVAQALHGLHAAHEAKSEQGEPLGIVHRDVSPQNVLVGIDGITRVLDFGVAKAIGRSQVTREGQLKGKLPYMAPEQIRRTGVVTRRTDVYAAAVVLWEALTAHRLFEGDDEAHILSAVLDGARDLPSSIEPSIPVAADAIAMQGLHLDPQDRFASALDMALALEERVGFVSAQEVAAWVTSLASDTIDRRMRMIRAIEESRPPDPDDETTQVLAAAIPPGSQASTISVSIATEPSNQRVRRRRVLVALLAAVFVVGFGAAFFAFGREDERPTTTATGAPKAKPKPSATPVSNDADAAVEPIASGSPPPATSSNKPHPPPVGPWKKHPSPPPPSGTCNPPYYYENGIKRFKPQCL